jgi:DNA-binding CsgD family transcriptional regulator
MGVGTVGSYDRIVLDDAGSNAMSLRRERGRMSCLTPRELEVLQMISAGMTNAEAARRLDLSVHGIKFHLTEIYRRLGVNNRTEAAVSYLQFTSTPSDVSARSD